VKVLIADDDLTSRVLLRQVMRQWGFETVVVADGQAAWEALACEDAPRLAVLDWMMPTLDGLEVCRRIRSIETPNPPYIILLTSRSDRGDVVAGLEAGANDYVRKPFDREELRARVSVGERFLELNGKLMQAQRALETQALTDVLTGAMNRRAILSRLDEEIARAERQGGTLGIGLLDVDNFKTINDTWGHSTGDLVLQEVADRSLRGLRQYDGFGRFGGEEFLVVLPGAGTCESQNVLARIQNLVGDSPVMHPGGCVAVTVSIGGAVRADESVDALLRTADGALYEAKRRGRARVVMHAVPEEPPESAPNGMIAADIR
jgi:diguanylate cyclase (GGDEF)-like protein